LLARSREIDFPFHIWHFSFSIAERKRKIDFYAFTGLIGRRNRIFAEGSGFQMANEK
jgi:hypothetical protein